MYGALKAAEQWVYASALSYRFNPKLPVGMTAVLSGLVPREAVESKNSKKGAALVPCTYIDVLEYLVGTEKFETLEIS